MNEMFPSIKALASAKGVAIKQLRAFKAAGADGFRSNSSINWTELSAWMTEHEDEIESIVEDSTREKLELQKLKEIVIGLKNKNRGKDADFISRKLVLSTVKRAVDEWSKVMTRYFIQEQPTKCGGMTEPDLRTNNIEFLKEALSILATPLNEWEQGKDLVEKEEAEAPKEGNTDAS